jgi:flagellar hook-basal body complex protein FliE
MVSLVRTNPAHLVSPDTKPPQTGVGTFEGLLMRALDGANSLQLEADRLGQQMIVDPDSVDAHDLTIAMAQANLAVSLTKAVVDGALEAYNNIINLR